MKRAKIESNYIKPAYMRLVTRVALTTAITHFERFKVCSSELTGKLLL